MARKISPPGYIHYGKHRVSIPTTDFRRCPWCGKTKGVEFLSIFGLEFKEPGVIELHYPNKIGTESQVKALGFFVSHADCDDGGSGYDIEISRILEDGANEWIQHLRQKSWWRPAIREALLDIKAIYSPGSLG